MTMTDLIKRFETFSESQTKDMLTVAAWNLWNKMVYTNFKSNYAKLENNILYLDSQKSTFITFETMIAAKIFLDWWRCIEGLKPKQALSNLSITVKNLDKDTALQLLIAFLQAFPNEKPWKKCSFEPNKLIDKYSVVVMEIPIFHNFSPTLSGHILCAKRFLNEFADSEAGKLVEIEGAPY